MEKGGGEDKHGCELDRNDAIVEEVGSPLIQAKLDSNFKSHAFSPLTDLQC
jgi:hypothetical protein